MASKVLVVGSGVIGLRTALELLRKNIPVVLRSSHPPLHPKTCSMGAGGLWMPYKCDDPRIDRWSIETLDELLRISKASSSSSTSTSGSNVDESCPVEIVPTVYLTSSHKGPNVDDFVKSDYKTNMQKDISTPLPEWTKDTRLSFQHLTIEMLSWQNHVHKLRIPSEDELSNAGYTHAWFFNPPVVDTPRMLMHMLNEIESHPLLEDSNLEMKKGYESLEAMVDDAKKLDCDSIVNCTGLGASSICNDSNLIGGRGVLLHYDRSCVRREYSDSVQDLEHDACILTEEGDWGTRNEPCYLIPRGNVLVVGGSYLEEDYEEGLRDEERKRLETNAWTMGVDTDKVDAMDEWVGWRPCRPDVRVQLDDSVDSSGIKVVHSYGAGGSGWTIFSGIAKEAVELLLEDKAE